MLNKDLEFINTLQTQLKSLAASIKKIEKLNNQASAKISDHSTKQWSKIHADLNYECMYRERLKTEIARTFKGSILDVSLEEKIYNPSAFHSYKG